MSHVDVEKKKKSYFFWIFGGPILYIVYEQLWPMLWFRAPYVLCKKYGMVATFYVMDVCLLREISVSGYGAVVEP